MFRLVKFCRYVIVYATCHVSLKVRIKVKKNIAPSIVSLVACIYADLLARLALLEESTQGAKRC